MRRYFPILTWAATYNRNTFSNDLVAALIVTIMLIPQSLAYALLAGLPPEVGLYASIAPLVLYTVFGTSRTLAVGPVAVASLMTAAAVGKLASIGTPEYLGAAILLAVMSGLMLLVMGVLRLGFIANFLSHPVISGFITASGILIAAGQVPALLGISARGENLPELLHATYSKIGAISVWTLLLGGLALGLLWLARSRAAGFLRARGMNPATAAILARVSPIVVVALTTAITWALALDARGVPIVGNIPTGLPAPALPPLDPDLWAALFVPALLISIVGYVETISVAQTLAAKRRQRIDPDQELVALGAANLGAGFSGGFPVTGGFARSVVNHEAGAETPAAGAMTAVGMLVATLFLTPLLHFLPKATLAATIILAVLSLVDLGALRRTWGVNRADAVAMAATIALTLLVGVEAGLSAGVALSIGLHLWRTSRPHVAVVGQVPGTEHFRNIDRHDVVTASNVLTIRVDESLYFPNARFLEDYVQAQIAARPEVRHLVLMASAVNDVDASALESLESIATHLRDAGVTLHLSEVKGPVMDRLKRSNLLDHLTGQVFLTQADAMRALAPEVTAAALGMARRDTARRR
ncbi:MAG: SulP family inorganic anion transporter [Gemmobacter sp.]